MLIYTVCVSVESHVSLQNCYCTSNSKSACFSNTILGFYQLFHTICLVDLVKVRDSSVFGLEKASWLRSGKQTLGKLRDLCRHGDSIQHNHTVWRGLGGCKSFSDRNKEIPPHGIIVAAMRVFKAEVLVSIKQMFYKVTFIFSIIIHSRPIYKIWYTHRLLLCD